MASVYDIKPQFQALLRPLVGGLAKLGVTANQVTLAAMVLSIIYGAALWLSGGALWLFLALPIVLLIRMGLNAVDGMLAREFHQKTQVGAFLNEIGDVVSDTALLLPLILAAPFSLWGVIAMVLLALLTEFVGVMGPAIGASRRYDGPMGKSDRAVTLAAFGIWIGVGAPYPEFGMVFTIAVILFLLVTVAARMRGAITETREA